MASRKHRKRRERPHHTAAEWLARLTGSDGKGAIQLPPDFVLWMLAGLLAHLDRRGDSYLADLAAGALIHGGGLTVQDDARWRRGAPSHQAALRTIAQAFADLDLRRGRRQDKGAWELLNMVEVAYTGLCVAQNPEGGARGGRPAATPSPRDRTRHPRARGRDPPAPSARGSLEVGGRHGPVHHLGRVPDLTSAEGFVCRRSCRAPRWSACRSGCRSSVATAATLVALARALE